MSWSQHPLGLPVCGDGVIETGEVRDDSNTLDGDGCSANCSRPACGNGLSDAALDLIAANEPSEDISIIFGGFQGGYQREDLPGVEPLCGGST